MWDPSRLLFIHALLEFNPLWYPMRYPSEYQGDCTIEQVIHYHYPAPSDIDQIQSFKKSRDFGGGNIYNAAFGFLDQNPHNMMHLWTGGQNPNADGGSLVQPPRASGMRGSPPRRRCQSDTHIKKQNDNL